MFRSVKPRMKLSYLTYNYRHRKHWFSFFIAISLRKYCIWILFFLNGLLGNMLGLRILYMYFHRKYCTWIAILFFCRFIGKYARAQNLGSDSKIPRLMFILEWLNRFCDGFKHKDIIYLLFTEQSNYVFKVYIASEVLKVTYILFIKVFLHKNQSLFSMK